jgi:WD40-like Beta Propeller Repeat
MPLTSLNTSANEGTPFLSYDALTLYFYSTRAGGPGDRDLWFATRGAVRDDFGEPQQVPGVNGASYDHLPWLSDDELIIYYTTEREDGLGHSDIWRASRGSKSEAFEHHALLAGINSEHREDAIAFSPDRLTAYFTTDRDTAGDLDIWRATRNSRGAAFQGAEVVSALNSDSEDTNLALTRDGKRLYFSSGRDGKQRLWVAVRTCL